MLLTWFAYRLGAILAGIIFLESERGLKLKACFWGIRDGLRGHLAGIFQITLPANSRSAGSDENRCDNAPEC